MQAPLISLLTQSNTLPKVTILLLCLRKVLVMVVDGYCLIKVIITLFSGQSNPMVVEAVLSPLLAKPTYLVWGPILQPWLPNPLVAGAEPQALPEATRAQLRREQARRPVSTSEHRADDAHARGQTRRSPGSRL